MIRRRGKTKGSRSQSCIGEPSQVAPDTELVHIREDVRRFSTRFPGLILIVLGLVMLRQLLWSPRFAVTRAEVIGTRMLSSEEIRRDAALLGHNIFGINQRQVEQSLSGRYACLEAVDVNCRLPGECSVRVKEIDDVLIWEQNGQGWWVALDGRVLGPVTVESNAPILRNAGTDRVIVDGYLPGVPWRLALETFAMLEEGQDLEFVRGYGLVLRLGEERLPVYLGMEGDAATKLSLARQVVAEAGQRGLTISYIDLRSEARPIVGGL